MAADLTPEARAIEEKRQALAELECRERAERTDTHASALPDESRRRNPWAVAGGGLASIVGAAVLAALVLGTVFGQTAGPDDLFVGQDAFVLGAFVGAVLGAVGGFLLWGLWQVGVLWRSRDS